MEKALLISRDMVAYSVVVIIDSTLPKTDQMRLEHCLQVELQDLRIIVIPADFVTDCHSTPFWSQAFLPEYNNKTNLAAIVHDWLYMEWETFTLDYPALAELKASEARAYSDAVYQELMERFNPGRWSNRIYLAGVRLFGWWNWRKFRKRNILLSARPRSSL